MCVVADIHNIFLAFYYQREHAVYMSINKDQRFTMRSEGEFKRRLEALKKKTGLRATGVVTQAVYEKYDREIGDKKKSTS